MTTKTKSRAKLRTRPRTRLQQSHQHTWFRSQGSTVRDQFPRLKPRSPLKSLVDVRRARRITTTERRVVAMAMVLETARETLRRLVELPKLAASQARHERAVNRYHVWRSWKEQR